MLVNCGDEIIKGDPIVTVLIPTLNAARFMRERIDSLLAQSFTRWEAIVYDSESTDDTVQILRSYRDGRLRVCTGPREGIYAAWNALRRLVRSEYCCIAPADDTMMPSFMESGVAALSDRRDVAAFACPVEFIDENSCATRFQMNRHAAACFLPLGSGGLQEREGTADALLHLAVDMVYVSMTGLLFRSRDFGATGDFRIDLGSTADREWMLRFLPGKRIIYKGVPLATWRVRDGQASAKIRVGEELRFRRQYETEFVIRGVSQGMWTSGLVRTWRRSARVREFLLRIEYRKRKPLAQAVGSVVGTIARYPKLATDCFVSRDNVQEFCRKRRIHIANALMSAYYQQRPAVR